jgi:hypothetical protein
MSLLEKEGSLKMEQLKVDNEERRKQAEQENKMRLDIIKEQMTAEREIQKMRLAAQKEIASSEASLRKEALAIEKQGGIDTQAYRDKMLQLQSLETIGNMYNSGMSDEQIASYASGTLSKMGINLPTVTSLPSMKGPWEGNNVMNLPGPFPSTGQKPLYNSALTNNAFSNSLVNNLPKSNLKKNQQTIPLAYPSVFQEPTTFNQPIQEEDNDFNNWYKKTILPTLNNLR